MIEIFAEVFPKQLTLKGHCVSDFKALKVKQTFTTPGSKYMNRTIGTKIHQIEHDKESAASEAEATKGHALEKIISHIPQIPMLLRHFQAE